MKYRMLRPMIGTIAMPIFNFFQYHLYILFIFSISLFTATMSMANGTVGDGNGLKWVVGLLNSRYKYLTAETFGCKVNANGVALKKKQLWMLEPFGGDAEEEAVCLKSHLGKYLAVDNFGNVTCDSEEKEPGAKFRVIVNDDGRWAFKNAVRGYFLGASDDKLVCSAKAPTEGEHWTVHLAARPQVCYLYI